MRSGTTRLLSAFVLLPLVLATIWFLPPAGTLTLALLVLLLGFLEYASLAERLGARIPKAPAGAAVLAGGAVLGWPGLPVEAVFMAAMLVVGTMAVAAARPGADALRDVSVALFPLLYLSLPIGALAAVRVIAGREALLLLLLAVIASDTGQYYGGRLFGRRPLARAVSPHKTVEGALAGAIAGTAAMLVLGRWWLPALAAPILGALGATIVALGIAGDLFESLLKRSAGVKDTSGLIPGHGGLLDRIDSLLFAAPLYYLVVRYGI